MTKKKDIIHVATPKVWDIKIEYIHRDGRRFLIKVMGRKTNKKMLINKYDKTINKGRSNSMALVIPQKKIAKKKATPAIKKRGIAKPLSPVVYTFIISCFG